MNKKLLFIDTETTGAEPEDRLIQVAYSFEYNDKDSYFKPSLPVKIEAMAVHHVTNEMLEGKRAFAESAMKGELQELSKDHVLIAHNAPFDLEMLKKEGVEFPFWIDTLKVAQHLIEAPKYNLQYLRYFLGLKPSLGELQPHDAIADVRVLECLFEYLSTELNKKHAQGGNLTPEDEIKIMMELSTTPVLLKKFAFGKYIGSMFEEIKIRDPQYLRWLHDSEMSKPALQQNKDLLYTLKHYLNLF